MKVKSIISQINPLSLILIVVLRLRQGLSKMNQLFNESASQMAEQQARIQQQNILSQQRYDMAMGGCGRGTAALVGESPPSPAVTYVSATSAVP